MSTLKQLPNTHICTWFYAELPGEESYYPQVGGISSSPQFQSIYLRCVVNFFATSLRQNPDTQHIVFTNLESLPHIGSFDTMAFLHAKGIQLITLPLTYQTPIGFHGQWRNQFYIFDLIKYLTATATDEDNYFILDSDCVWIKPVSYVLPDLEHYGLLTYDLKGRENIEVSEEDLKEIYTELDNKPMIRAPIYFGGEWFAAKGKDIKKVADEVDSVWQYGLHRFEQNQPKLIEEAYALSYIYHRLGYTAGSANPHIKRMWTAGKYIPTNVSNQDYHLTLWHLPDEKKSGLRELFYQVINPQSKFWHLPTGKPLIDYLGGYLGVPKSNWRRQLWALRNRQIRTIEKVYRKVQKLIPILPTYVSGF